MKANHGSWDRPWPRSVLIIALLAAMCATPVAGQDGPSGETDDGSIPSVTGQAGEGSVAIEDTGVGLGDVRFGTDAVLRRDAEIWSDAAVACDAVHAREAPR